jgi:hypothetical protein
MWYADYSTVRTLRRSIGWLLAVSGCFIAAGATLQQLSLDGMIAQSTAIVRGKVTGSYAVASGPIIYTFYEIQVSESLKGDYKSSVTVAVPGGTANNLRQTFPGAPQFNAGDEFVFFLWTGKSGLTQVIGLTQGLFKISTTSGAADPLATRAASSELMFERGTGRRVKDQTLTMNLSDLKARIASIVGTGGVR